MLSKGIYVYLKKIRYLQKVRSGVIFLLTVSNLIAFDFEKKILQLPMSRKIGRCVETAADWMLPCCEAVGKSFSFSGPQFSHLCNEPLDQVNALTAPKNLCFAHKSMFCPSPAKPLVLKRENLIRIFFFSFMCT